MEIAWPPPTSQAPRTRGSRPSVPPDRFVPSQGLDPAVTAMRNLALGRGAEAAPTRPPAPPERSTGDPQPLFREYQDGMKEVELHLRDAQAAAAGQLPPGQALVSRRERPFHEVVLRSEDGSQRRIRYNDDGRVYVQYLDREGQVLGSVQRHGDRLIRNPRPDGEQPGAEYLPQPGNQLVRLHWRPYETMQFSATDGRPMPEGRVHPESPLAPNEIPGLRQLFDRMGVDGRGVTIAVLDDLDLFRGSGGHSDSVARPARGLAPGANVEELPLIDKPVFLPSLDSARVRTEDELRQALRELPGPMTDQITKALQGLKDVRVVNLSVGGDRTAYYHRVFELLQQSPELRGKLLGPGASGALTDEAAARIVKFVDGALDEGKDHPATSSAYQKSLQAFHRTVDELAKRQPSMTLVMAGGNEGPSLAERQPWARARPGALFDDMLHNPNVISVAGSNGPEIWHGSTRGEGEGGHNPTLAAPSVNIDNGFSRGDGTSLGAPYVAGVIALMLQVNPNLTPQRIRELLQATARPAAGGVAAAGAGIIDPERAVLSA